MDIKDGESRLVVANIDGARCRIYVNKIGKGALGLGLSLQLIALFMDP